MCHTVTHDGPRTAPHTDALGPLGRPGRGRRRCPTRPASSSSSPSVRHEEQASAALADVRLPEPGLADDVLDALRDLVGAEHVLTDHESRVRRTRGKSTPDLLKMRAGDGSDAPDVVVRPGDHDEVAALVAWCSERRVALVPFGGGTSVVGGLVARRDGYAGVVSLDLRRLDRLVSVDAESGTAVLEAGLLGPEAEASARRARAHARPLPAVVRVRLHRRLRRHPLQRPGIVGLRPLRRARRRAHRRHPDRRPRPRQRTGQRGRPGPARARARAPRARSA